MPTTTGATAEKSLHISQKVKRPAGFNPHSNWELQAYIDEVVDMRSVQEVDHLDRWWKEDVAESKRTGRKVHLTKTRMRILRALIGKVSYQSTVVMPQEDMALLLGCSASNLMRTLKQVEAYTRVSTARCDMRPGHIRVDINPRLYWKAEAASHTQQYAHAWWLRRQLAEASPYRIQ